MHSQERFIGQRFEKCVIERLIGRGGYGLSFLAFDEELQEYRVIKISQIATPEPGSEDPRVNSFIEEGLILSRLNHPQIVTLRGQGELDKRRYMILDFIHGNSVRGILDIVAARRRELNCAWDELLDPITASALILSTLYPLEYAHGANVHLPGREVFGVAHRDISPGNLILGTRGNEKGKIVLIDFGTAKTELSDNITINHNLVGTVPYMGKPRLQKATSTEQISASQSFWNQFKETRHDVHALGVLYFELLTGRLPFPGETIAQIIVKILDADAYDECHAALKGFPEGIGEFIRKCIVFHDLSLPLTDQAYQFPDASAMLKEMETLFHRLAPHAAPSDVLNSFCLKLGSEAPAMSPLKPEFPPPPVEKEVPSDFRDSAFLDVFDARPPLPRPKKNRKLLGAAVTTGALLLLWPAYTTLTNTRNPPPPEISARDSSGLEKLETPKVDSIVRAPRKPRDKQVVQRALPAEHDLDHSMVPSPESSGAPSLSKNMFAEIEALASASDRHAFEKVTALLREHPDSPDLLLLKCRLILNRNPTSMQARNDLAKLRSESPAFLDPVVFRENVLYLLWKVDTDLFEQKFSDGHKTNLIESSQAYLSEFRQKPQYAEKVHRIAERIPQSQ